MDTNKALVKAWKMYERKKLINMLNIAQIVFSKKKMKKGAKIRFGNGSTIKIGGVGKDRLKGLNA